MGLGPALGRVPDAVCGCSTRAHAAVADRQALGPGRAGAQVTGAGVVDGGDLARRAGGRRDPAGHLPGVAGESGDTLPGHAGHRAAGELPGVAVALNADGRARLVRGADRDSLAGAAVREELAVSGGGALGSRPRPAAPAGCAAAGAAPATGRAAAGTAPAAGRAAAGTAPATAARRSTAATAAGRACAATPAAPCGSGRAGRPRTARRSRTACRSRTARRSRVAAVTGFDRALGAGGCQQGGSPDEADDETERGHHERFGRHVACQLSWLRPPGRNCPVRADRE